MRHDLFGFISNTFIWFLYLKKIQVISFFSLTLGGFPALNPCSVATRQILFGFFDNFFNALDLIFVLLHICVRVTTT